MKRIYQLLPKGFVISLLFWFFILLLVAGVSKAQFFDSKLAGTCPRTRMGCYPCSTLGTDFLDFEKLGQHAYRFSLSEKNGILYTCRGGHIDTAHLRKAADWTAFVAAKTFEKIKENANEFSFKLMEPTRYYVGITYPENWKDLSEEEKEDIAFDISIRLGEYFVYTATTWHEIITWFGYKCTGILYPEFASAFTWEDTFSNLLGTYIAAEALRDKEHEYNEAVTLAFERELQKLGVQPGRTAKLAAKKVKGKWFSSNLMLFINMKKRHFDIGLDDGFVTPAVVPSVAGCEGVEPLSYPVPTLDFLSEYGFSVKFEIEPRVMEGGKILRIVYSDSTEEKERIDPAIHFAAIMDYIKEEAIKKYGSNVDLCDAKPLQMVKATESKERIKPVVHAVEVTDNITEDEVEKIGGDVKLRDTRHPQQLVKAVNSPIKTYDFGFKVSRSYLSGTSNETIVVADKDSAYEFDIEELAFMASQWLDKVNE